MAESLYCFTAGDRLLTMADSGEARIWEVSGDGWLELALGPPRQVWEPVHEPPASPATAAEGER